MGDLVGSAGVGTGNEHTGGMEDVSLLYREFAMCHRPSVTLTVSLLLTTSAHRQKKGTTGKITADRRGEANGTVLTPGPGHMTGTGPTGRSSQAGVRRHRNLLTGFSPNFASATGGTHRRAARAVSDKLRDDMSVVFHRHDPFHLATAT